jgi:SAM-dependent methyltransferase
MTMLSDRTSTMPFTLAQILPWGRSFAEYVAMFGLTAADLDKRILGCGDGPASFNAAMYKKGKAVVSVDPLYEFSKDEISRRVQVACPTIIEQVLANQSAYVWTTITSPQHLGRIRMEAMDDFLEDYDHGKADGRYVPHELPTLPFEDNAFDLALCSHLLFTYSEQLAASFHVKAVLEICRVAREVRIFPIVEMSGQPSRHIPAVCEALDGQGVRWSIESVEYEFQRGGNKTLMVKGDKAFP